MLSSFMLEKKEGRGRLGKNGRNFNCVFHSSRKEERKKMVG